jgi:DNA-binding XRE family transcriptional regulator
MNTQITETGNPSALVRDARRKRGMTQADLAEAADCTQSAISMFENGRTDVLSKEKIATIEQILNIVLPAAARLSSGETLQTVLKHCPNFECPASTPYAIGPHLCCCPPVIQVASSTRYCAWCGELLACSCNNPDCRRPLAHGSFCPDCGTPYVLLPSGWTPPADWMEERNRLRVHLLSFNTTSNHPPRSGAKG